MKKKKIAIISLPLMYNYGGFLQSYALMEFLRIKGFLPVLLIREHNRNSSMFKLIIDICKKVFERIGAGGFVYLIEKKTNSGLFFKTKNFRQFKRLYIRDFSPKFTDSEALKKYCQKQKFDYYITGSDQIWRKAYMPSLEDAFLNFAPEDAIKLAYAPSFGTNIWDFDTMETDFIEKALNNFRAVSVREKDGINMLINHIRLSKTPRHVLDPTFLLPIEHYIDLSDKLCVREGTLLYMLSLDDKKQKFIRYFSETYHQHLYTVINPETNCSNSIKDGQGYPVEQWLAGFRDASYVLTDSFHAIVFSIIFQKPFWVFENPQRGNSRLNNILDTFELKDRLIKADTNWASIKWEADIAWEKINAKKRELLNESVNYLISALQ